MTFQRLFGMTLLLASLFLSGCQGYFRDSPKRTAGEATDDRAIHTAIKSKLVANGQTRGWKINVDVFRGNVTLRGYVKSEAERITAMNLARNTTGVQAVEDLLVLLPPPKTPGDS